MEASNLSAEIILSAHDEQHIGNLQVFKQTVEKAIKGNPIGKIAIFTEDATGSYEFSSSVTKFVDAGFKPTDAFVAAILSEDNPTLKLSGQQIVNEKEGIISQLSPYAQEEYRILDDLTSRYPNRIHLVPEWQPENENGEKAIDLKKKASSLAASGNFSQALPLFKESVRLISDEVSRRESNITGIFKNLSNREDISQIVGIIGAAHISLESALKDAGVNVTLVPTDQEKTFDPYTQAVIQLKTVEGISDGDWKVLFSQFVLLNGVKSIIQPRNPSFSRDTMTRGLLKATKDFTPNDFDRLEKEIQQKGLRDVVLTTLGIAK